MKEKKRILAVCLSAALILGTAGCGSGDSGDSESLNNSGSGASKAVTVRIALQSEDPALPLMEKWAEENKDIVNLEIETAAGNDLRTKLTTDMASNNVPDIFYYWTRTSLKPYIENDMLLDIQEYFEKSTEVKRDLFNETDFYSLNLDGGETAYGIPCGGSTQLLACNKDLFEAYDLAYPSTYEELLECAEVFKENGIIPISCGSSHGDIGYFLWSSILYQYADVNDVNKIISEPDAWKQSEAANKASQYISEMAEKGLFPSDTVGSGDFDGTLALYNAGQAAMFVATCWKISSIEIENTDFITYPEFPDAVNDPSSFTTGGANNGIYINKSSFEDTSKTDAIIAVMDYYCSDEVMTAKSENMSNSKILDVKSEMAQNPVYQKFLEKEDGLDLFMAMWALMPDVDSREVYMDKMDSLYAQQMTPEEFTKVVQEAVNKDLE